MGAKYMGGYIVKPLLKTQNQWVLLYQRIHLDHGHYDDAL